MALSLHRTGFLVCVAAVALVAGVGCHRAPTMNFTAREASVNGLPLQLRQPYPITAMCRDAEGDYDVVLVSPGIEKLSDAKPGDDLTPASRMPVRQVLHLKLHWRPYRGATADNPASANATVRWILFGASGAESAGSSTTPPPPTDYIEYQGTAFVQPKFEREGYYLRIRAGNLTRAAIHGDMEDVLGPADFEGNFYIPDDPHTVANTLRELPPESLMAAPAAPSRVGPATRPARRR